MSGWNPQTWQALIDRYSASLVMFAAQWVADPEDVVQEAYFELFRQPTPPDAPPAWLFAVVRNKALTAIRSESTQAIPARRAA